MRALLPTRVLSFPYCECFGRRLCLAFRLPSASDLERKHAILEYVANAGRRLIRLAVIARWSKNSLALRKCMVCILMTTLCYYWWGLCTEHRRLFGQSELPIWFGYTVIRCCYEVHAGYQVLPILRDLQVTIELTVLLESQIMTCRQHMICSQLELINGCLQYSKSASCSLQ